MKSALLAALILAASLSSALGQTSPRTPTMNGEGEMRAAPDSVTLSAGVTSQAPGAAAVLAANNVRMQSVFAALRKLGVADKDMQTSNFSISPQISDAGNRAPHVTGYQVINEVRVRLDDVTKLGAALDALFTAGANQMNSVDFTIKDSAPLLTEARGQAVADARAKAETYAKAAGVNLGPILSISENANSGPRPVYSPIPMMSAARSVPVAAGEESVTAQVSIVWEIH
jgi:uncharacterized protein YggE